ncbi:MAG TPA: hypothetical protein VGL16_12670 [Actinomycetota bacterium]
MLLGRFGRRVAEDAREAVPVGLRDGVRAAVLLASTEAPPPSASPG